jgi:hypothetical protein
MRRIDGMTSPIRHKQVNFAVLWREVGKLDASLRLIALAQTGSLPHERRGGQHLLFQQSLH